MPIRPVLGIPALVLALASCAAEAEPTPPIGATPLGESRAELGPPEATIVFRADWTIEVRGRLVEGGRVHLDYDPARLTTCRGTRYGREAWSIGAHWRIRSGGEGEAGGAGTWVHVAPRRDHDVEALPTFELPRAGELEIWFENNSAFGCQGWDSAYGANYRFRVEAAADGPAWMGRTAFVTSRATCDGSACEGDRRALEDGFSYETWARQRAAIAAIYFEVWEPGLTDRDDPDLWQKLDVQMHLRWIPGGPVESRYVDFDRRVGNNARYAVPLRSLDPLGGFTRTDRAQCPTAPLTTLADGQYVETSVEYWFTVNGARLAPAGGGGWRGRFVDYAGLYAPCL